MAPKAVRTPTRKAAVASPAAQRVGHLLEGARTYADSTPQLAAFLGRRALQVAAESDGPLLPRGAAASLCNKCGLPFTSHVYKGAAVVTLAHKHVRRRLQKAAADAAKGKHAQPVNRAALRYTCQLCGHATMRTFLTRQAAEEVLQKTIAQQERLASSGGAPGPAAAPREGASKPAASPATAARQAPPTQVAAPARAKETGTKVPAASDKAAPSHQPAERGEEAGCLGAAELAKNAAMLKGGAAGLDAMDGGLGPAALGTERTESCEPETSPASPASPPQPAEEEQQQLQLQQREQQQRGQEQQQREQEQQQREQDEEAGEAQPGPEPMPQKRRRISWEPKLEHIRSFEVERSSVARSGSPEALAAAAGAAALGRRLLWKSWFRIGRVWKVARH